MPEYYLHLRFTPTIQSNQKFFINYTPMHNTMHKNISPSKTQLRFAAKKSLNQLSCQCRISGFAQFIARNTKTQTKQSIYPGNTTDLTISCTIHAILLNQLLNLTILNSIKKKQQKQPQPLTIIYKQNITAHIPCFHRYLSFFFQLILRILLGLAIYVYYLTITKQGVISYNIYMYYTIQNQLCSLCAYYSLSIKAFISGF
eukprot:TRINITY_DN6845_c0_g1_i1.p1 TRINITY_DN6845_c0_g1~~TRINITY_DN6845_c0_g1_i1.p1  ORF type:complete len:212 (+),score=-9.26 TRINITY_DN6845_c0_g1_i1:35-637(+)